jgi:plasmid stability protein
MNQLTVRGFDDELRNALQQLASKKGISLNKAALLLLRRGAGADKPPQPNVVGSSLDHLIGTWSEEEAAELESAIESCEQIDEAFWE